MSRRTASGLAWSSWAVTVALEACAILFDFLTRSYTLGNEQPLWLRELLFVPGLLAFVTVGAFVAARRPAHPIGWLFIAIGLAGVAGSFAEGYWRYALVVQPGALPVGELMRSVGSWPYSLALGLMLFGLLLFPDGRLPSRRWRLVAWLVMISVITAGLSEVFKPGQPPHPVLVDNVLGIADRAGGPELMQNLGSALTLVSALLVASSLIIRLRRARGVERQQLKWFAYAAALFAVSFSLLFTPWAAVANAGFIAGALASGLIPIGAGIAVLRYRLYDIDLIINRTLVYGALTALVVGIYVLVVGYLGTVFRASGSLAISLIATGIVAVLFQPLRDRVQRGVNHLIYGERDEPYAVIARLGRRLEGTFVPDAVLSTIVATVREALKLPYAAITLATTDDRPFDIAQGRRPTTDEGRKTKDEGGISRDDSSFVLRPSSAHEAFAIAAASGTPPADMLPLPLVYQGETIGQLLLAPRAAGEAFSPADRRLLDDLARQAGIAVHAVRLTADLQRSRQRLVTAREEERRRLRRDLHDGLGATLAALNLQAGTLRSLIPRDPAAANALVVELRTEIRAAIADIRRLVYDLRPPALDELGLVGAIRARAAQCHTSAGGSAEGGALPAPDEILQVIVDAPEQLPPLPAAVEVATYRIVQEALTNVVRHARARTCVIRLDMTEGLRLEIADDGIGLLAEGGTGVGLGSMRERAAELGGTCVIETKPHGGTQVLVRLPLPSGERRAESVERRAAER